MSPSKFEFLINLIGEKILKRTQHSGKPFLFKEGWHWCCVLINSMTLPSFHSISQLQKCSRNHTTLQIRTLWHFPQSTQYQLQKRSRNHTTLQIHTCLQGRSVRNEKKGRGVDGGDVSPQIICVSHCTSTPAQAETISSLWCHGRIPTAHQKPPFLLLCNQLLIHYVVLSPVHTVTIRCYGMR